jgi:hypothetical protein
MPTPANGNASEKFPVPTTGVPLPLLLLVTPWASFLNCEVLTGHQSKRESVTGVQNSSPEERLCLQRGKDRAVLYCRRDAIWAWCVAVLPPTGSPIMATDRPYWKPSSNNPVLPARPIAPPTGAASASPKAVTVAPIMPMAIKTMSLFLKKTARFGATVAEAISSRFGLVCGSTKIWM